MGTGSKGQLSPPLPSLSAGASCQRRRWLGGNEGQGLQTLTSSRGPEGASLTSGSCLPLASRMVMMELGMCACWGKSRMGKLWRALTQ